MINGMITPRLRYSHKVAELFDSHLPYFKGSRKLRNILIRLIAPKPETPITVSTRYGFKINVTSENDDIDENLYYGGTYEAGTLHIIASCLRSRDIVVDVGANIGVISLLASRHVGEAGKVYAFEPVPETFSLLQHNIELNQAKNISTFNMGLGKTKGFSNIYINKKNNRGTASFMKENYSACSIPQVPVKQLDKFVTKYGLNNIRLIKIDVEGWELEVLLGGNETS